MLGVLLLGGCAEKEDNKGAEEKESAAEAQEKQAQERAEGEATGISPADLPAPPKVKDKKGDIQALSLAKCPTDAGKVKAKGTIKSSAKDVVDYVVSISWTNDTSDVMGRGDAVLRDVKPGDKVDFSVKADVAEGATRCVTGVIYGKVK
jgi:hypothetical protein